jgi:protein-S-isoprenylcysteine O-methyltransferase Ste14
MSKAIAVLGSALFFVIAPLVLAGFVPWWVTQWEFRPAFFGVDLTRILGGILIIVGVPGLVDSFARFALEGLGTPAPIAPTQKLVVTGLYRYVRNPIYIAVVAVIFGQALLFGDWRLLWYGALLCGTAISRTQCESVPEACSRVASSHLALFGALIEEIRFARDSPLEESGFEPVVPR